MEFTPSSSLTNIANEELAEKLIKVSQDYITYFNNRNFSALRSMSYLFASGYTHDVRDWQRRSIVGWNEYATAMENEFALPPELSIVLKEAQADVDFPKGTAEVFILVEQRNRYTGITIQGQGRITYRCESAEGKWFAHRYTGLSNAGLYGP